MDNKIEMKKVLDRIEIDGDAKQFVCVTPEGEVTRLDLMAMTLDQAYEAVSKRGAEGIDNVKTVNTKDSSFVR